MLFGFGGTDQETGGRTGGVEDVEILFESDEDGQDEGGQHRRDSTDQTSKRQSQSGMVWACAEEGR